MALPSEGQLYSLLGQTTSSEYKRRRDEERDFKRSLRRDQMKAMLLQPLIGAAATTGMEAVGDFLGDRFLKDGGKNFLDTEKGYALSNKLTAIRSQQAELKTEYDSLNKADAYKTMVERLANEKIQQLGLKPGDTEATFIKQDFASEAQRANILKGIEETKADLLKQMTLLGKAPTNKQLLSRLQNRKFYYGKGKISKLFSTGFNKVLGRDMDEIKARGLNYLLTGSEDEDRTTIIAEALKNSDNIELNQLALNSRNLMFADDQFVRNLLVGIEEKNPDFYNRLRARVGDNKDEFIRQNKLFENFYLQDHENYRNYVPEDSFIESYVNTEKALKARKDLSFDAFRQGMSEHLFRDYQEGTKGWIKSQRLSKENTDKFEAVYKRLDKNEGETSDTIAQKQKVINEGIEETYQHSLATFRSFISNGDPRVKALSAASEEDIKAALNKFAYETQIQIDPDNEYAQVFLSVGNEEQERIRFANTLDNIMDDERYKTATGQAKIQFEKNFQGVLKDLGYDSIDDVSNNLILSSKGKRDLLNKAVNLTIDTFKTDKNLGSYKIDAIGAQARALQKNINNIFPDDSPRVPQTTLNIGLEASRKKFIADQDRKLDIRNTLTAGADTKKSLLIDNALVRAGYDLSDQGVIDAVVGKDKLTSLLAKNLQKI